MGHRNVQEAMTSSPTAITPETTAQEAARLMKSEDVGALPVVEDGPTCVITDRDLAIRAVAEGLGTDTAVRSSRRRTSSRSIRSRASEGG